MYFLNFFHLVYFGFSKLQYLVKKAVANIRRNAWKMVWLETAACKISRTLACFTRPSVFLLCNFFSLRIVFSKLQYLSQEGSHQYWKQRVNGGLTWDGCLKDIHTHSWCWVLCSQGVPLIKDMIIYSCLYALRFWAQRQYSKCTWLKRKSLKYAISCNILGSNPQTTELLDSITKRVQWWARHPSPFSRLW